MRREKGSPTSSPRNSGIQFILANSLEIKGAGFAKSVGNTGHQSSELRCPVFQRQREIHKIMAHRDLSFRDAASLYDEGNTLSGLNSHLSNVSVPLPTLVLNNGSNTWASADLSRSSAIDLTIVSDVLAPLCTWAVCEFHYGSDHFPVITTVSDKFSGRIPCRPYYSVKQPRDEGNKNCLDLEGFRKAFDKVALVVQPPSGSFNLPGPLNPLNSNINNDYLDSQISHTEYFSVIKSLKQTYPPSWRDYFVIFIPKPGRKGAYNPISLASNLLKIVEKVMCRRLEWWVENNNVLSPHQFGFRRGLSCTDNLATLVSSIKIANNSRQVTGAVFLDIEGAFDNVVPDTLVAMLPPLGITPKMLAFLTSVVGPRRLQRSSLACLRELCPCVPHADDVVVFYSNPSVSSVARKLNTALDQIQSHLTSLGLQVSPSKSVATFYSLCPLRNMKWLLGKKGVSICMGGVKLNVEWSIRFLGVHIDYSLSWKKHVAETRRKFLLRINILKALAGIRWGSHSSVLLTAYKGLVRSVLEWGCQVMFPRGTREGVVLDRLQYACARVVCGLMRTTPTNVLLDVIGEQPLRCRHKYLVSKYVCRVYARSSHPLGQILEDSCRTWEPVCPASEFGLFSVYQKLQCHLKEIRRFALPGSLALPFHAGYFKCEVDIDTKLLVRQADDPQYCFSNFLKSRDFSRVFFTDGSRAPGSDGTSPAVGFAVVSKDPELIHYERVSNNSTIFDAEAQGVICALEYLQDFRFAKAVVASDSLSVISCSGSTDPKGVHSPLVYRIKELVMRLRDTEVSVVLMWVPGHSNVRGNEMADRYAKRALTLPEPHSEGGLDVSSLFPTLRREALDMAKRQLQEEATSKETAYFQKKPVPLGKPWFVKVKKKKVLPRPLITLVSRIRSHHTAVNLHLKRKGIVASSECPCGHPVQDVNHVFFQCPMYKDHSDKLVIDLYHNGFSPPYSVEEVAFSKCFRSIEVPDSGKEKPNSRTISTGRRQEDQNQPRGSFYNLSG
ncbi:uncharacterized protein LOC109862184 [Pseudomyrmex gracilis]|uniref:uncharacterized protein LOC109862184 n=1 Tax=Pseudomyrmex gracilis TaxID=219809 RepID=UPI000995DED9|nr:uncharacterized protein LOC109862184 [Pseudomyrmex gracilis]